MAIKTKVSQLSIGTLRSQLEYKPEVGAFVGKVDRKRKGTVNGKGYLNIIINGTTFSAHKLAWMYMTGKYPEHDIDFVNNNRADIRWVNLREANRSQIAMNKSTQKNSTTGVKGLQIYDGKYKAVVRVGSVSRSCNTFALTEQGKQQAIQWLEDTRAELHGEFANNGKNRTKVNKEKVGYYYEFNAKWLKDNQRNYNILDMIPKKTSTTNISTIDNEGIRLLKELAN